MDKSHNASMDISTKITMKLHETSICSMVIYGYKSIGLNNNYIK